VAVAEQPPVNGKLDTKPVEAKVKTPVWEFLADEERDIDGTATWLYRLHPVIDRKQGEHAICKKKGRFSRDDILREFGSGVYQVQVNNFHGKQLYSEVISFHNPDLPPRVDPLEVVVGDPRNDVYFQVWGKKPNTSEAEGKRERGSAKGETAEILNAVFEKGAKIDPALVDLWKEASSQRDELAKRLADQPAAAQGPAQPDLLQILTQVKQLQGDPLAMLNHVKELQADPFAMLVKLREFFPATTKDQPKPEHNSLDDLKRVLDVFGQAKELFTAEPPVAAAPVGPGPDAELWERIAVNLSGQIAPTLQAITGIILAFRSGTPPAAAAGAAPMTPPGPVSFDPYRDMAAMRNFARSQQSTPGPTSAPTRAGATTPPAPGEASAPNVQTAPSANDPILSQLVMLINQALNCMNRGIDGHQCAQAIMDLNGDLAYDALVQQIKDTGVPVVIELVKGIPELTTQATAYEAPLRAFIEEFLQGPPYDDEATEEERQPA
jgi:hypothetical protein